MVSDDKNNSNKLSNVKLTDDQKKELAKKSLAKEVKGLITRETSWNQDATIFDKLPAHEKPFPIEPFPHERQRLPFKMSDEDRLRRKMWVEAQELTEREPMRVPELERVIYNPIRRFYRAPTDRLFAALTPILGETRAPFFRFFIPKLFLAYLGGCVGWYIIKYHKINWEEKNGINLIVNRRFYLPEEEKPAFKKRWDYADNGFQSRNVFKGKDYAY